MDDLDALLADLQNSVPGHQQPKYNVHSTTSATARSGPSLHQHQQSSYGGDSSGYGSLRGKGAPVSPIYQEHYSSTETRNSVSPGRHVAFNGTPNQTTSQSSMHQYQNHGSLSRSGGYNGTSAPPPAATQDNANLSELDSLLVHLNSQRYNNSFGKKENEIPISYNGQPAKYNTFSSYTSTEERPTVDSLLKEMDNATIYAVPNGGHPKSPTPGRHVTITVRETKTEKLTGPDGPVGTIEEKIVQQKDSFTPTNAAPPTTQVYASSATKELDDIMASLSNFQRCAY